MSEKLQELQDSQALQDSQESHKPQEPREPQVPQALQTSQESTELQEPRESQVSQALQISQESIELQEPREPQVSQTLQISQGLQASRELLPAPLRGDSNYRALSDLLDRLGDLELTKLLVYWLDIVDASALPFLAKQFHVMGLEGWSFAHTEAEQRALLKQAVELHRRKGTLWAVRQGIKRYDPDLDVQEWFEYGGEPFYFRLSGGKKRLSIRQAVEMFHTVEALKSLRSKIDGGIEGEDAIEHVSKFLTAAVTLIDVHSPQQNVGNAGDAVFVGTVTRLEVVPERSQLETNIQPTFNQHSSDI